MQTDPSRVKPSGATEGEIVGNFITEELWAFQLDI
jgi:hypothetical protein